PGIVLIPLEIWSVGIISDVELSPRRLEMPPAQQIALLTLRTQLPCLLKFGSNGTDGIQYRQLTIGKDPQRVIVVSPLRVIGSKQVEKKMIRSDDKFYYSFMGKKVCRIDIGVETLEFGIDP